MKKLKKLNEKHIICIVFTCILLALSGVFFTWSTFRIGESLRDFGLSFAYFWTELFDFHVIAPTVIERTAQPFHLPFDFPETWEEFKVAWHAYWEIFTQGDTVLSYISEVGTTTKTGSRVLILLVPVIAVIPILFSFLCEKENNKYNVESKPLVKFKRFSDKVYRPVKAYVFSFIDFLKNNSYFWKIWLFILAYSFNFISVLIEFFAFYFYFVVSFDLVGIYTQVVKLLYDLQPMLDFVPVPIWVILGYLLLCIIRKIIGLKTLSHMEMKNRGFINERPIVSMVVGTMGKKKTTMLTDMALSAEMMFRDKAFELILENDMKFPNFPWIHLENALKKAIKTHSVYNLYTVRRFVKSKRLKYKHHPKPQNIFFYQLQRYPTEFNNELFIDNLWDCIENYACLYFIYIVQSSLLISNYSIRTDCILEDVGNFPKWDEDFFQRDPHKLESFSRHAHILDYDTLRLGQRLTDENDKVHMFEFGVITITEIGKERCNNLELQEVRKKTNETNQKNDLFNTWLKMCRHTATVNNYPFIKVIVDEQRPESWGADARDLCQIVHINETSESKLAMPCFALAEIVNGFLAPRFQSAYYDYRFHRGDNILIIHLLKNAYARFYQWYMKKYNLFGYVEMDLDVEDGTQDGEMKKAKYYLMSKKIYSKRFSTDCFSEFFAFKTSKTAYGINDLVTFKTEKATFDEMLQENSYFFNELNRLKDN